MAGLSYANQLLIQPDRNVQEHVSPGSLWETRSMEYRIIKVARVMGEQLHHKFVGCSKGNHLHPGAMQEAMSSMEGRLPTLYITTLQWMQ